MLQQFDIAIIGGGMVGLALARALKDTSLKIAIIESAPPDFNWDNNHYDLRVSAINLSNVNFFIELGVWASIEQERISMYDRMFVWTDNSQLEFNARDVNKPELGFIIENRVIRKCLWEKLTQQANVQFITTAKLHSVNIATDNAHLITTDGQTISAKLLIGADGAHSWLREQLSFTVKKSSYGQTALVTTVHTQHEHQNTAWQHFLPQGPLALLPLSQPHYCSIVWSTHPDEGDGLQNCSTAQFNEKINLAFDKLGQISITDRRLSFPLNKQHLTHYVQHRVAFMGDAAHTIHPLAGQGVNLGFRDAHCLAAVIREALAANKDFAETSMLRKYERQRKADNTLFLTAMDALNYIFTDAPAALSTWRDRSINLVDKSAFLKKLFIEAANDDAIISS